MKCEYDEIATAYCNMYSITEELHSQLNDILNSNAEPKHKLNQVVKTARNMIGSGIDTGLESDKPKKGSSRAVFFPKEGKKVTIDGQETSTPTAIKIAFGGTLDKHHGEDSLLGEDQNRVESDNYLNRRYGIISRKGDGSGTFESSNLDSGGVLAPVFDNHEEYHHLEMGRVTKYNAKDLAEATKTPDFPKGLTHREIHETLGREYAEGHGHSSYSETSPERLDKVRHHPWVSDAIDMMNDSGMHPADLVPRNMGIYKHPITGKKHACIIDWGYNSDIAKKYAKARKSYYRN